MYIGAPQLIWLILLILALGISLVKHGEPKPSSRYNLWRDLFGYAISVGLLYWGGFFTQVQ